MYTRGCYINRRRVNGKPDVRFETVPTLEDSTSSASDDSHSTDSGDSTETTRKPKLVLVTEVSQERSSIHYLLLLII